MQCHPARSCPDNAARYIGLVLFQVSDDIVWDQEASFLEGAADRPTQPVGIKGACGFIQLQLAQADPSCTEAAGRGRSRGKEFVMIKGATTQGGTFIE